MENSRRLNKQCRSESFRMEYGKNKKNHARKNINKNLLRKQTKCLKLSKSFSIIIG